MYRGRFHKAKRKNHRLTAMLVTLSLILMMGVGATLAYIQDNTEPVKNEFQAGEVPPTIQETFVDNEVKKNVTVKNDGTVPAYIRAAIAVTWQNDQGNVMPEAPVLNTDYSMELVLNSGWVKGKDGLYYYTSAVAAGGVTTELIKKAEQKVNSDYTLHIEILAQTIQADGVASDNEAVVLEVWGTEKGGSVESVGTDGTLTIKQ